MYPPFLVLDGYRDDEGTKDYVGKDKSMKDVPKGDYADYFFPAARTFMMDNHQWISNECGYFESQFQECMKAFGSKLGRLYCDLEHRDFHECVLHEKQEKRIKKIREVRYKQWLRGERKTIFEPLNEYMKSIKPNTGGMTNKPNEDKNRN